MGTALGKSTVKREGVGLYQAMPIVTLVKLREEMEK